MEPKDHKDQTAAKGKFYFEESFIHSDILSDPVDEDNLPDLMEMDDDNSDEGEDINDAIVPQIMEHQNLPQKF